MGNALARNVGHLASRRAHVAHQAAGAAQNALSGARQVAIQPQHTYYLIHTVCHYVHMVCQQGNTTLHIGIIHILAHTLGNTQGNIGDRFGKHLVHLSRYAIGTLIGNLGRNGVLLFVGVINKRRLLGAFLVEGKHGAAKAFGNNHCRVVAARARTVNSVVLSGKHPVNLVVCTQGGNHAFAHVHLQREQVAFVAFVHAGHGHRKVARFVEYIPARKHVVPGEQRRHQRQANGNNYRNHIGEQAAHFHAEQGKHATHGVLPSAPAASAYTRHRHSLPADSPHPHPWRPSE